MAPFRSLSALVLGCLLIANIDASLSFDDAPADLKHLNAEKREASLSFDKVPGSLKHLVSEKRDPSLSFDKVPGNLKHLVSREPSLSFDDPPSNLKHLTSHRRLARRRASANSVSAAKVRRDSGDSKRCKVRDTTSTTVLESTSTSWSSSSTAWSETTTWTPEPTTWSSSSSDPAPAPTQNAKHFVNANAVTGLINVQSNCGDIGATKEVTATSGPNGNINWLNCGLNDGGWNPPYVRVEDLITADLGAAVASGNSPFTACSSFIDLFYTYGGQYGIPPIMLASFAMQESSCRPDTVGGAGEQGLMQLTKDKCGDAPGGNCQDPDYNIRTGAKYFADSLAANNGNAILTIGRYNGWNQGLTVGAATAAANTQCCRCQQNCDYLHQFVNGWLQNVDAYTSTPRLGQYFNLDVCN